MKKTSLSLTFCALAFAGSFTSSAQAAVLAEDFSEAFPMWESHWFGTNSTARNFYCGGATGCSQSSGPYLWVVGESGGVSVPVEVKFMPVFGSSLTTLTMDVATFAGGSSLDAYDVAGDLIFSQVLTPGGALHSYSINSGTGIGRFTFSGNAAGNTQIDNLFATTSAIPETQTYSLMLLGLAGLGVRVRRRL